MPRPKDNPKLEAIYARVPAIECRGLCVGACGPVPVHPTELKQIRLAAGRRVRASANPAFGVGDNLILETRKELHCTLLRKGRCTIYHSRPMICRLFGVADGLPCPFGCQPERLLSRGEVEALVDAMSKT